MRIEETYIRTMIIFLPKIAAVFTFLLLLVMMRGRQSAKLVLKSYEELAGFLKERSRGTPWYLRTQKWLVRNGASFHLGAWITPERYLLLRLLPALAALGVVSGISPGYGAAAAVLIWFLPGWLIVYLNGQDNLRLLPEIKLVYNALEIQIRAGVYLTDALAECYGSVREKRLRKALLDLAGDIVMNADIYEALDHFQGKFDNRYIDSLCITVLQALESGQAVELLGDIAEQIKDMESTVLGRKKGKLDRSITFYQLGVLVAVLGVTLWAIVQDMFQMAAGF